MRGLLQQHRDMQKNNDDEQNFGARQVEWQGDVALLLDRRGCEHGGKSWRSLGGLAFDWWGAHCNVLTRRKKTTTKLSTQHNTFVWCVYLIPLSR